LAYALEMLFLFVSLSEIIKTREKKGLPKKDIKTLSLRNFLDFSMALNLSKRSEKPRIG